MANTKVSVALAKAADNAITVKDKGLYAPHPGPTVMSVSYSFQQDEYYWHKHVLVPGISKKTHCAWAEAPRYPDWFFNGKSESRNLDRAVTASAAIGDGVLDVIITRPSSAATKVGPHEPKHAGGHFQNVVNIFIMRLTTPDAVVEAADDA